MSIINANRFDPLHTHLSECYLPTFDNAAIYHLVYADRLEILLAGTTLVPSLSSGRRNKVDVTPTSLAAFISLADLAIPLLATSFIDNETTIKAEDRETFVKALSSEYMLANLARISRIVPCGASIEVASKAYKAMVGLSIVRTGDPKAAEACLNNIWTKIDERSRMAHFREYFMEVRQLAIQRGETCVELDGPLP